MGNSYILWVHDEPLEDARRDRDQAWKIKLQIGEGVLALCQPRAWASRELPRSQPIRGYSNALQLAGAGEVSSSSEQLYFWSQNCLRALYDLDLEDLESAKRLIEEAIVEKTSE